MRNITFAFTLTAAVLTSVFAQTASAQPATDVAALPAGVEVITISAKRVDPAIAKACVASVMAQTSTSDTTDSKQQRRSAIHSCIVQATATAES